MWQRGVAHLAQLFNFQWLARSSAGSLFLLFTYSSRRRLFKDQLFFEQTPAFKPAYCASGCCGAPSSSGSLAMFVAISSASSLVTRLVV